MNLADKIREYVLNEYVLPLARRGVRTLIIKAGKIHYELGLENRVPAVVSALSSKKFIDLCNEKLEKLGLTIKLVRKGGPAQSTTTTLVYTIDRLEKARALAKPSQRQTKETKKSMNEEKARRIISEYLGMPLYKAKLNVCGKYKEFDIVNTGSRIVGDIKGFTFKGQVASAEYSNLIEYLFIMERLEKCTGEKWRKIIVGYGRRKIFEDFARRYNPWLEDLEIYFIEEDGSVRRIR